MDRFPRITEVDVQRVLVRAQLADEAADAAGLLFAEAVVTGLGDIVALLTEYKRTRASAQLAWGVVQDAQDQAEAVPA